MSHFKAANNTHNFKQMYVLSDGSGTREKKPTFLDQRIFFKAYVRETGAISSERLRTFLEIIPDRFVYEIENALVRKQCGLKEGEAPSSVSVHAQDHEKKLETQLAKWLALNEPLYRLLSPKDPNRYPPVLTYPFVKMPAPLPDNWEELTDNLRIDMLLPEKKDDTLPTLPNGQAVFAEMGINNKDKVQREAFIDWLALQRVEEMKAARTLSKRVAASKAAKAISIAAASLLTCAAAFYGSVMHAGEVFNLWPKTMTNGTHSLQTVTPVIMGDSSVVYDFRFDMPTVLNSAYENRNMYPDYKVLENVQLCKSRSANPDLKDLSGKPASDCFATVKKDEVIKVPLSFGPSRDDKRVTYVVTRDGKTGYVRNLKAVKLIHK